MPVWAHGRQRFRRQAFPWFEKFRSRDDVIEYWRMHGALPGHPPDYAAVLVAILMDEAGRREDAAWLLRQAYANVAHENPVLAQGFAAVGVAAKLGITL